MDDVVSPWRGRRVLVTGCTGFLGGAVVRELLARGAEVVGLVRDRVADAEFARHGLTGKVRVVHGRVEDTFRIHSALAVHEARAVFHLAAGDPNQPDRGTTTVIEAVRRYDPRVPVVTARPAGEVLSTQYPVRSTRRLVPLGVARFGELFGGGDRKLFRVVPAAVLALLAGEPAANPAEGPARDFVFVRDAARACVLLAEAVAARPEPRVEDLPFHSGWSLTGREMAAAVRDVFEGRTPRPSPADPVPNPLGWAPRATLPAALTETIDWYREFVRGRPSGNRPANPPHRAAA